MTYAHLDYPPERLAPFGREKPLLMECNTDFERQMRVVACAKEPWTVALIESMQRGEVLWDVGANVGSYSLLAAAREVLTVAFEPVRENLASLDRNLALNDLLASVIVAPYALGAQNGLAILHRSDMRSGAASHILNNSIRKATHHQQLVHVLRADDAAEWFQLPVPHALKIDVDGNEREVLQGAERLMGHEQLRALLIEMHVEWDGALTAWLAERGWQRREQYEQRGPIYYALFGRDAPVVVPLARP